MACPKCGGGLVYVTNIDKLKCLNPECTYSCSPPKRLPSYDELEKENKELKHQNVILERENAHLNELLDRYIPDR